MIVVENVDGALRLVCKARHEFGLLQPNAASDPSSFFHIIEEGEVGGFVPYLTEGTEVDFWINDRVYLDKLVLITQSIIFAERTVHISEYTAIGQSFLHIRELLSFANGERTVQMLDCRISCDVLLISASVVTNTRIECSSVSIVASEVQFVNSQRSIDFSVSKVAQCSFDYDREEALQKEGAINPAMYDTVLHPIVQCTASQLTSVNTAKDVYLVTASQCELMSCEIECSVLLLDVIARNSKFHGHGVRILNSWFRQSIVESMSSSDIVLNAILYDQYLKVGGVMVFEARQTINGRYDPYLYAPKDSEAS